MKKLVVVYVFIIGTYLLTVFEIALARQNDII